MLKEHNLKVTPQRVAILEYLLNTHTHPTAEAIFSSLTKLYPSMSLATVYKTLDTLKNEGIVNEINIGEDSNRYDVNMSDHAHFKCSVCSAVTDLEMPEALAQLSSHVLNSYDVSLTSKRVFFYGECSCCVEHQNFLPSPIS